MEVRFNMSLLDKLKKNSTIKDSAILAKSKFPCAVSFARLV